MNNLFPIRRCHLRSALVLPALVLVLALAVPVRAEWEDGRSLTLIASADRPVHLELGFFSRGGEGRVGLEQSEAGQRQITLLKPMPAGTSGAALPWSGPLLTLEARARILLENPDAWTETVAMGRLSVLQPDGSRLELGQFSCVLSGLGADAKLVLHPGGTVDGCRLRDAGEDTLELTYRPGAPGAAAKTAQSAGDAQASGAGSKRKPEADPETPPKSKRQKTGRTLHLESPNRERMDPGLKEAIREWVRSRPCDQRIPPAELKATWLKQLEGTRPRLSKRALKERLDNFLVNERARLKKREMRLLSEDLSEDKATAEALAESRAVPAEVREWTTQVLAAEASWKASRTAPEEDKQAFRAVASDCAARLKGLLEAWEDPDPGALPAEGASEDPERLGQLAGSPAQPPARKPATPSRLLRVRGISRYTAYNLWCKDQPAQVNFLPQQKKAELWQAVSPEEKLAYREKARQKTQAAHDLAAGTARKEQK